MPLRGTYTSQLLKGDIPRYVIRNKRMISCIVGNETKKTENDILSFNGKRYRVFRTPELGYSLKEENIMNDRTKIIVCIWVIKLTIHLTIATRYTKLQNERLVSTELFTLSFISCEILKYHVQGKDDNTKLLKDVLVVEQTEQ